MLEKPFKIRNCDLKNRIIMPPMARMLTDKGIMTKELIQYYLERADFLGLLTVEFAYIMDKGLSGCNPRMLGMHKENIPLFKELTSKVHEKKCPIIIQIVHCGIKSNAEKPVGPSNVDPSGKNKEIEELSKERIKEIYNGFIDAALLAKEGGFDGIEVHAAHGFLLNQFYSPLSNKRTDEYGGTVENRIKLTCDIIKGIREATGENFMISVRLGAADYGMEGGSTIADAVEASKLLEKSGADMISISGGFNGMTRKDLNDEGYFRDASTAVKQVVHIPVLLTGGILTKAGAEKLLESGACDLIGIGRPLLKNPNYIKEM